MSLECNSLQKKYGDSLIFDNLSVSLPDNSFNIIMGPSGCGKTTLLRILSGIETADNGSVTGIPKKVAYSFEKPRLLEHETALSNLLLVRDVTKSNKQELTAQATSLLSLLGLNKAQSLDTAVSKLSAGQRARVDLARALFYDAPLILLDEVFSNLDFDSRENAAKVIRQFSQNSITILVTHNQEDISLFEGANVITGLFKK